jgi:hypothetical protein
LGGASLSRIETTAVNNTGQKFHKQSAFIPGMNVLICWCMGWLLFCGLAGLLGQKESKRKGNAAEPST